jgi:hypothetical protein
MPEPRLPTEIAHVLYLDQAGTSLLPMEQQARLIGELRELVKAMPEFVRASERNEIIAVDTGDGMALVFFRDPLAPVQCAIEIARAMRAHSGLKLRMGIHSGPVSRTIDLNGHDNVTGSGINIAQRVMDCGDPGHILLSSASADFVREYEAWASSLFDLGECEVKHGQKIHLYNLVVGEIGRADLPSRISGEHAATGTAVAQSAPGRAILPVIDRGVLDPKKIVLLYKRGAADDERLLGVIEAGLKASGDDIFIDRHLQIGVVWAQEIERRILDADAVVPVISRNSSRSEMLEYELQIAHQAGASQGGRPRILPVRVGFRDPLPDQIGSILNARQYAFWRSPADDEVVVAELVTALHAKDEPVIPIKHESVGGAVPLDSKFYVVRPTDEAFLSAIADRDSIVLIKGGRQMGKTSLLARGLQQARESGSRVVLTDFQTLSGSILTSADSLFLALAEAIVDQLDMDADPRSAWNPDLGANTNFERFMRRQVLADIDRPMLWGLDEVDRLFPPACSFGTEVFGLFRSWHNRRSLDPAGPWSRLTLAIAYATEAHLFITDLNQSPFNVGTRLTLDDFTVAQIADLNARYGRPLADPDGVARLHALLGGQPYLVRRALDELSRRRLDLEALESEAANEDGPFGDHLRRILVTITQDDDLIDSSRQLLRGQKITNSETFYRMRSAGVILGGSPSEARFRCRLYEVYLAGHLL